MKRITSIEDALSWFDNDKPMRFQVIDKEDRIYVTEDVYVYALVAQFTTLYEVAEFLSENPTYAYYDMQDEDDLKPYTNRDFPL